MYFSLEVIFTGMDQKINKKRVKQTGEVKRREAEGAESVGSQSFWVGPKLRAFCVPRR